MQNKAVLCATAIPLEKNITGCVEPVPEFYNRLFSLTKLTLRGLEEMQVLNDSATG